MLRKVLIGAALVAFAMPLGAGAKELTYGSPYPPKHLINTVILETLAEDIAKSTNKEVTLKIVTGGALFAAKDALDGTGNGLADSSGIIPSYVTTAIPYTATINELQFYGKNGLSILGAAEEMMLLNCPQCLKEFRAANVVYLGSSVTSAFKLMCSKPFKTTKALKGVRVRSSGAYSGFIQHLGMVPVKMTSSELPEGLERGQIQCTFGSVAWLQSFSLYDVVKHVVDTPMGYTRVMNYFFINSNVWGALSPKNKKGIVMSIARSAYRGLVDGYEANDEVARKQAVKHGITFEAGGSDIDEAIASYKAAAIPSIVERAKKRGVQDPQGLIDTYIKLQDKWEKIVASTAGKPDAFIEALQREIYSKVDPEKL